MMKTRSQGQLNKHDGEFISNYLASKLLFYLSSVTALERYDGMMIFKSSHNFPIAGNRSNRSKKVKKVEESENNAVFLLIRTLHRSC